MTRASFRAQDSCAPLSGAPVADQGTFVLTPKGLAYALSHDRDAIERRINRHLALATALLAFIDDADRDPDLEPDLDDEPSLGWTDMEGRYGNRGMAPTFDPDREVDDADDEPSLWAPEPGFAPPLYGIWRGQSPYLAALPLDGQGAWARGRGDDDELSITDEPHDGELDLREGQDNEDAEYSLGWPTATADASQAYGAICAGVALGDLEADGLESGEADEAEADGDGHIVGGGYHV